MLRNPTLRLVVALAVTVAVLCIGVGAHLAPSDTSERDSYSAHSAMAESARAAIQPHGRTLAPGGSPGQLTAPVPGVLQGTRACDLTGRTALGRGSFAIPLRI